MSRRLEFDRDAAIELVMNEMWVRGYEASSVKQLSEKLGITRSSFYNAFGSREDLFKLALQKYACYAPTGALAEMTSETPLKPALTRILREVCKRRANEMTKRGCMVANSVAELLPTNRVAGKVVADMALHGLERYEELINWAVQREELPRNTDVRGVALALHSLMLGLNTQSKLIHDEEDLWRSASTTLRGLGLFAD